MSWSFRSFNHWLFFITSLWICMPIHIGAATMIENTANANNVNNITDSFSTSHKCTSAYVSTYNESISSTKVEYSDKVPEASSLLTESETILEEQKSISTNIDYAHVNTTTHITFKNNQDSSIGSPNIETIIISETSVKNISNKEYNETPRANFSSEPDSLIELRHHLNETKTINSNSASNISESDDECHFLSFEEWKKLKVQEQKDNNTFTNSASPQSEYPTSKDQIKDVLANATQLEEDQGKLYKDRINYASIDCAATIVKTNSDTKGASGILVENKDKYLLNKCSLSQKFIVIELCEDIIIDSIVMGNFEFFSSTFKEIRFSVSDRFPVNSPNGWKCLGEFTAQNIRGIQSFDIENPLIWARYLKVELISHYGNEFYCPVSLLRVHGKTMMEEYKMIQESNSLQSESPLGLASQSENISSDNLDLSSIESEVDECKIELPSLGLEQFLSGMNVSATEYCDAIFPSEPSREFTSSAESNTAQDSIFKNIMKRLQLLEANASLSLLYIEEQSKLLSTAFSNLERRQRSNFETLISSFNGTMHDRIHYFMNQIIQLQQQSAGLIDFQKETSKALYDDFVDSLEYQIKFYKQITIFNSLIAFAILIYFIYLWFNNKKMANIRSFNGRKRDKGEYIRPFVKQKSASKAKRKASKRK